MNMDREFVLDKRLAGVRTATAGKLYDKIEPLLRDAHLLSGTGKETEVHEPLTPDGLHILLKNLANGTLIALSRADIQIPNGYELEEISLTDSLLSITGKPTLKVDEENIQIHFTGENPIIKSIKAPLDPDSNKGSSEIKIGNRPRIF